MRRAALLFTLISLAASAQDVIRVTSKEVLVDVVVRDKKGRFLHKLSARDFTVTDDGVPQQIVSFREASGSEVTSGGGETRNSPLTVSAPGGHVAAGPPGVAGV